MSEDESKLEQMIVNHASQLAEHFDVVQIFCSSTTDDSIDFRSYGSGNVSERYYMIKSWILRKESSMANGDNELEEEE